MKTNFELRELIYIYHNGRYIDLHNDFNFAGYDLDAAKDLLILKFTRHEGEWIAKDEYSTIILKHQNLSYKDMVLDNSGNDDAMTISEMTFFPANERDVNDKFLEQELPDENDDILYTFENGNYIRIGCGTILFEAIE